MSVKQMALVWDLDLAPNERLILLAYADHADDDGDRVYPSLARVAHKTGYSVDQVRRLSRQLVESGLMELVEQGHGRGNTHHYKLTLEKGSKLPAFEPRRESREKVASDPQKVAPMPPEPSIEPSVKNSRRGADAPPKKKNWFTEFCNKCEDVGLTVTPEDRDRVPSNLKYLTANRQATEVEIQRVLTYMLDARLRDYPMSPQEALNKVRGTQPRRHLAAVGSGSTIITNRSEDEYDEAAY